MDLHRVDRYDADVERVLAMLSDETFLKGKFAALDHAPGQVLELDEVGSVFRIKTQRVVEIDVPGFARKFLTPTNTLVQTDDWGENINGVRVGTWTIDAKNVPVTITGTIRLAPVDAGCTNTIDAHIKSSIPLVGGKIEGVVGKGTEKTMEGEYAFGVEWLARQA